MFMKPIVILLALAIASTAMENRAWDLAVAVENEIQVFNTTGRIFNYTYENLHKIKAITFNSKKHQFIISEETDETKDTIYTMQLSKETDIQPIVPNLPDDVQGLAVDPVEENLYYAEIMKKTINVISLKDTKMPSILFNLTTEIPQDIAVDSCKRYLFWSNSNSSSPTIERSSLEGSNRKILVDKDIYKPSGIAIDHSQEMIYWVDRMPGIYFRIERIDFNGENRKTVYEDTHQRPYSLAIDKEYVYWSDISNNALWRKNKHNNEKAVMFAEFANKPMGVVARNLGFSGVPDCTQIIHEDELPELHHREYNQNDNITCLPCLNGGVADEACNCECARGYAGTRCELDLCYNYCNEGRCQKTAMGPKCLCSEGYSGKRCEKYVCDNYCLNDGVCQLNANTTWGVDCTCNDGFEGTRCEILTNFEEKCKLLCSGINADTIDENIQCRCESGMLISETKYDVLGYIMNYINNPILLWCIILLMLLLSICLTIKLYKLKHMRPRIKKRIVVNRNVTPLTYRPQPPTEQCEITIENCCNMNVCETPCYEPPTKKDEKKQLLANMEHEDLY